MDLLDLFKSEKGKPPIKKRKPIIDQNTKKNKLIKMFNKIGDSFPLEEVLKDTGIESPESLRVICHRLRADNIIFLRNKFGYIIRCEK